MESDLGRLEYQFCHIAIVPFEKIYLIALSSSINWGNNRS